MLRFHPDKVKHGTVPTTNNGSISAGPNGAPYSIDQITQAYAVLSVPKLRAQYDKDLILSANDGDAGHRKETFRTGVEIVDLDDLDYDDKKDVWYRGCRCGDERGFEVMETDLEEVAEDGEINVGCRGCSLWMKVLFGVVDDTAEAQDTVQQTTT